MMTHYADKTDALKTVDMLVSRGEEVSIYKTLINIPGKGLFSLYYVEW